MHTQVHVICMYANTSTCYMYVQAHTSTCNMYVHAHTHTLVHVIYIYAHTHIHTHIKNLVDKLFSEYFAYFVVVSAM